MSRAFCFLSFTNFSQGSGDTKSKNWIWCFGSGVSAQWQLSVAVQDCGRGRGVSCTARGEVRSHINYFSPHSADGLPPTTRVSHSPTRAASERARNQSLSLFLRLPTTVSLSLVLSLRIFPNFVSVLLPFPHSSRTLMPYGKSIFRRSPHCQPSRLEGRRSCNVFATYLILSTHLVITIVSRNQTRPLGNTILFIFNFSHI